MKRKRGGRKTGKKAAPATDSTSPDSPSSPSTEATNSPPDQPEEDDAPVATAAPVAVPEPPPPAPAAPPPEPPQKPGAAAAPVNPADMPYTKPKVGAVYGRVKLKFKPSKPAEPSRQPQSSPEVVQAPAADAGRSRAIPAPEVIKEVAVEKATTVLTDRQGEAEEQKVELSGSDKEKVVVKIGGIKIKSAGLSAVGNSTLNKKADLVDDPPTRKQETEAVSENNENEGPLEARSSQESEEKQSTPERQRDDKELSAALEAIKKVMKMDAAEPFNTPVDPVALGIPDYFDVIDTPMDFGTICQELERGNKYMNSENVYKDVQFVWDNCTKYNSKGDYIIELMKRVKKGFMKYWSAAGLYTDTPESGGNDNTGDEDTKGVSKSKSKNKRRRPGNDRHKNDCACAVCQVTRRKKERDEILAVIDIETGAVNSNTSDQNNMEGSSGANNPGIHDTSSSHEQPRQTDLYKEPDEANDSGILMENLGNFTNDRPSNLLHPDFEDEGSRQYEEKEQVEYTDLQSQEERTPTQPNEYSDVEHHREKQAQQIESSQDVEMEDCPIQQENPSFLQLCSSLFPTNQSSIFRGSRHSLFRGPRRAPLKESPLHAAMAVIMKR